MAIRDEPSSTENKADVALEGYLRELPAQQVISDEVAIRLAHARASAVAIHRAQCSYWPFAAVAASFVLMGVFGVMWWAGYAHNETIPAELASELDVIMDENERDLIYDLEFYQWLSEMEAG